MDKEVSWKISWMTFIGNILILMGHSALNGIRPGWDTQFGLVLMNFFNRLAWVMMGWFFFISSYLFYRNLENMRVIFWGWKKRIVSLIIPYVIWNTVGLILQIVSGDYTLENSSIWFLIRNTYLFYDGYGCANGPLWYIARFLTFLLFAPIIYKIFYKRKKIIGVGIIIICIICNIYFDVQYYDFSFFLPIHLAGAHIGMNFAVKFEKYIKTNEEQKNRNMVQGIWLLILFVMFLYSKDQIIRHLNSLISQNSCDMLLRYMSLWILIELLKRVFFIKQPTQFVRSAGMYIYCSHDIIFRAMRFILIEHMNLDFVVTWVLLVTTSLTICVGSWLVMKAHTPRLLNILSGGRSKG